MRYLGLIIVIALSGCNTVVERSNSPAPALTADDWLAGSDMPRMQDRAMSAADVASFLRRTGFEPSPDEIRPYVGQPRSALIRATLDNLTTRPVDGAPAWALTEPRYWGNESRTRVENDRFRSARDAEVGMMRQWWVQQMIQSPSPMAERMVMFWDNTFVVGYSGLNNRSHALWGHHQLLRTHAVGDYRQLLAGIVRDPAVLRYLDNTSNTKEAPNENLARELFELYSLGEGNYSERDIKQAALALTGWGETDRGGTRFQLKPWAMAGGSKAILGQRGHFDGDDLPALILDTPAAARYVVTGLYHEFISSQAAPAGAIDDFARAFRDTGYQIDQLLQVMLESAYFWDPSHQGMGVKSPAEFVVGTVRATQTDDVALVKLVAAIQAQGQNLLDPPDVSGYDGGIDWLAPEYLIERQRFAEFYQTEWHSPGSTPSAPQMMGTDSLRIMLGGEAYQGPPEFWVTINHDGGTWYSDEYSVAHARDTERLGRYQDKSNIEWAPYHVPIPDSLTGITRIGVRFIRDAAGNGGDRNLFVAGVDYQGRQRAASQGTQSPGCRGDSSGAKRNPGYLYCSGELSFEWAETGTSLAPDIAPIDGALNTREWVLGWMNDENDRWRSINFMFDGLEFEGREWAFFGFEYSISERGERQLQITGRDCIPECFERWPTKAWRDKAGVPSVSVPLRGLHQWSMEHYDGLSKADRALVKALIGLAPQAEQLLKRPREDRYPERTTFWLAELATFAEYANDRRWKTGDAVALVELSPKRDGDNQMGMGNMMAAAATRYRPASGVKTADQWQASAAQLGPIDWALATPTAVDEYAQLLVNSAYFLR
ncbi:DUF1800 family protein [Litorivicinus lipolyticus]|uniref:DUF1800 family protein n=1 Tax=Litorivicinus lipolyticus TaxID=418701 RepID=A0A5Q2QAS4_9GAMM|nr:DUF1800 domain-containing protein [Litorivicinus lipolyticus]QGG79057.1 DUF1800 family protein [Litorivicinus lipolyticus]